MRYISNLNSIDVEFYENMVKHKAFKLQEWTLEDLGFPASSQTTLVCKNISPYIYSFTTCIPKEVTCLTAMWNNWNYKLYKLFVLSSIASNIMKFVRNFIGYHKTVTIICLFLFIKNPTRVFFCVEQADGDFLDGEWNVQPNTPFNFSRRSR